MASGYEFGAGGPFWNGIPLFGGGGVPVGGAHFYVKPSSGSDGNTGKSPAKALKTLSKALSLATANKNDVVHLIAESNTAASTTDYQSAALDWNKDLVHLVGECAPSKVSQRSRIANTASANISPILTVSADGCIFSNLQVLNGDNAAAALLAVSITGTRNYFRNVHFAGIGGGATQSAAGAADIKITGSENVFDDCVIGLDTIERDADATNILFDTDASRNLFNRCLIQSYISAAGYAGVTIADATGIDRWLWFRECLFFAKSTNKATAQTSVFSIPAISQGAIILQDSYAASDGGAVDWDSNNRGIIWNNSVAAAVSAAGGILTNQ